MRRIMMAGLALALLALPVAGVAGHGTVLAVSNGSSFYDTDGDCVGDTNDHTAPGAQALRHWHVGLPFVGPSAEIAGGFGCLGGPTSWTVAVPGTGDATLAGSITYTWDQQVPGGGENDVHLHVYDANGDLVASTLTSNGPNPVVPFVAPVQTHTFSLTLPAGGTYTIVEDVFSGEHTAWLSNFTVTH